jgi:hypothetical protein
MRLLGLAISCCVLLMDGLLIWRGVQSCCVRLFPLFYAYILYDFSSTGGAYLVYWVQPSWHASVYWFCYVLSIIVEFAILVEISDHIFQPFPAIRSLGRAITIIISGVLGLSYVLPAIFQSQGMQKALLDFALRTSITKAVILAVLFIATRHFDLELGRNVAGLMLGFSIYLGVNVATFAASHSTAPTPYARILWVVSPLAYIVCLLVWTRALWQVAPLPITCSIPPSVSGDSKTVAVELARFNGVLSRFIRK